MAVQDAGAGGGAAAQRLHKGVREVGGPGEQLRESAQAAVQEAEVAGQSGVLGDRMKESEAGVHSEAAADGDWNLQHPRSRLGAEGRPEWVWGRGTGMRLVWKGRGRGVERGRRGPDSPLWILLAPPHCDHDNAWQMGGSCAERQHN